MPTLDPRVAIFLRQWKVALRNTAAPPWQKTTFLPGVELRTLPVERADEEYRASGEYLVYLEALPEFQGLSFALNGPQPKVWLPLPEKLAAQAVASISAWCRELPLELRQRLGSLVILLGPDLQDICAGLSRETAFVAPHMNGKKLDFLIGINYPQPNRGRRGEAAWLQSALIHELEHVWQLLTVGSSRLGQAWKSVAEMCAVYAEWRRHPDECSVLDFGADFLRRLPEGLLAGSNSFESHPCWCFPFIEHLERVRPDIHRELWREYGRPGEDAAGGPWLLLDRLLQECGSALTEEWRQFCQALIGPANSPLMERFAGRFPPRLPSVYVNLAAQTREIAWGPWESWVLSAHWVAVRSAPGKHWSMQWTLELLPAEARIFVVAAGPSGVWKEVQQAGRDGVAVLELPGDGSVLDLVFIHAGTPDLRRLYNFQKGPLPVGAAPVQRHSLDPAHLSLRFIPRSEE